MNEDLQRLVDDPSTNSLVREHLAAAGDEPVPGFDLDVALSRHHVLVQTGGSAGSGSSAVGTGVKIGAGVLFLAGIGVGVVLARAPTPVAVPESHSVVSTTESSNEHAKEEVAGHASEALQDQPQVGPVGRPDESRASISPKRSRRLSKKATTKAKSADAGSKPNAVRLEARETARARAAVDDDPDKALRILDAMDRDLATRFFAEERSALRVLAHWGLGHEAKARRLGRSYLERHPRGTLSARVREAMGTDAVPEEKGKTP